ncbi:MAG: peptidoglycan-binding protein [Leptolyngbyaceae cyanobacterium SL_7_1]|nr:peptidoglycan-binding protein [Leptolyngbyaceae cyanobacterium SL_7_1]
MSDNTGANHYPFTLEPTLQVGNAGAAVMKLQQILIQHGAELVIDGVFGSQTQFEVMTFQESRQLPVNGIVDAETWAALQPLKYLVQRLPLKLGDRGWAVTEVQKRLVIQGAFLIVDGVFGFITRAAVQVFQDDRGLPMTGEVDRATWEVLKPPEAC